MDGRLCWFCLLVLLHCSAVRSEQPTRLQAEPAQSDTQAVTFQTKPAEVGQRTEQQVSVDIALTTRTRQGAEILEESKTRMTRRRRRVVTIARTSEGIATAAYVKYLASDLSHGDRSSVNDPIAGKRYFCQRRGDAVHVLTDSGEIPPEEEFKQVSENMDMLGKPNPLAGYLAGKHVEIGERLTLPAEVAGRLLSLSDQLGEVTRFQLTLTKISERGGRECAEFLADIEAHRTNASQMRLLISGPMVIETATCRAVSSALAGPIGMSQSMPDPRGRVLLDSTGKIGMRVSARFHDSPDIK